MTVKETIFAALMRYRGDDYERASLAFRQCTPEQMQELYGQSGRTRQAILDDYRNHFLHVERALSWLKAQHDYE